MIYGVRGGIRPYRLPIRIKLNRLLLSNDIDATIGIAQTSKKNLFQT